jgi:hypothetical protein
LPRKSAIEREMEGAGLVAVRRHERPDPPAGMSEAAAAVWRAATSSMRPGWFSPETFALLERYCAAMTETARLEAQLARTAVEDPSYDRLSKHRNATATSALSYARALRITPHSNRENKLDGRDRARSLYRRPWELDDDDGGEPRQPWEIRR